MKTLLLLLLAVTAHAEQLEGLLNAVPADVMSSLMGGDSSLMGGDSKMLKPEADATNPFKKMPATEELAGKPKSLPLGGNIEAAKLAAAVPVKKIVMKKAVVAKGLAAPKLKAAKVLKKKPKVYSLKPIVHVIEKPVPVYHKVPVPKKVLVPKFYPVVKKIPFPKIVPVPFKVPVKKIIPKIVKIPKAIPIPKIVPVKKPVPIPIPYPVPKFYRFPVPKPVPYKKYIPIPIPKKVPKFIPVPVKKIIKVPKPYYVPIKVPHITTSYVRSPMVVDVPDIKKYPYGKSNTFKKPISNFKSQGSKQEDKFMQSILGNMGAEDYLGNMKGGESDSNTIFGSEDQELLKLLSNMPGEKP